MPRREKELDLGAGPVAQFAYRLRQQRVRAGITYRELARRTGISHATMVRAASGNELPSWLTVRSYLMGCGLTHQRLLKMWESLWIATNEAIRPPGDAGNDPALALRHITTPRGFGEHLEAFAYRHAMKYRLEPYTLRALAEQTGVPRSTLADWFSGRRLPNVGRLYQYAGALDATQHEQSELRLVRDRLAEEQKAWRDLDHYSYRALEQMQQSTTDPRARLELSHALLRAGEQRLLNDSELSKWQSQAHPVTGRSVASNPPASEKLDVVREQDARLNAAQNRVAAATAKRESPGVWGATVARNLHEAVHQVTFPQAPPRNTDQDELDD